MTNEISKIYSDIADLFYLIAQIEKEHCKRYQILLENVRKNNVFHKSDDILWKCSNCGYEHAGKNAPATCPVCKHPQSYFYEKSYNYL